MVKELSEKVNGNSLFWLIAEIKIEDNNMKKDLNIVDSSMKMEDDQFLAVEKIDNECNPRNKNKIMELDCIPNS